MLYEVITFGKTRSEILAPVDGIVIGQLKLPLVNAGDAIFNIASFINTLRVKKNIDNMGGTLPYFYD